MKAPSSAPAVAAALRRCPLFGSLGEAAYETLARHTREVEAAAGAVVFREGDPPGGVFVIVEGRVRIVGREETEEYGLAVLGPGESFGEMSFLEGTPRSATAETVERCRLVEVARDALGALRREEPESWAAVMAGAVRLVAGRLREANRRLVQLARLGSRAGRELEEMRSHVLTLISHELRTPLTIIRSSAQVLRRADRADERGQAFLRKIEQQSERLRLLIDDLIALASLQVRPLVDEDDEVEAAALVCEVLAPLFERAEAKGQRVAVRLCDEPSRWRGSRRLLGRAVHHLIDNAVKFSPPESEIRVELEPAPAGRLRLRVVDEGAGIAAETRSRVFEAFFQGDRSAQREFEGLGIGLALAKQVAEAHGGRLEAGVAPGGGAAFTMELPAASPREEGGGQGDDGSRREST